MIRKTAGPHQALRVVFFFKKLLLPVVFEVIHYRFRSQCTICPLQMTDHELVGHNNPTLETHHLKWFSSWTYLGKVVIANKMQASHSRCPEPLRTCF